MSMDVPEIQTPARTDKLSSRTARLLRSRHAGWWLAAIAFAESLFAPIIIDPFLVALIFAKREAWIRLISISIAASVAGGIVAYILGALFYDTIGVRLLEFYHLTDSFAALSEGVDTNGFVFILLGALTPVPYKLVALAGGLFQMNFVTFLFASIVGRVLRLGLVGAAAYVVGPHALPLMRRYLLHFAYVVGALLILYIIVQFIW